MKATWSTAPRPVAPPEGMPAQPTAPKIKVLHVITKFWAGAGSNTLLTAIGTDRSRYEVWVTGCEGGPLWERAAAAGVHTVTLAGFRESIAPISDLRVLLQLVRLIRRERFAIVHGHSAKGGFLGRLAAWLCRTPVVIYTFHGFSYHDFMSRRKRWMYVRLERLPSRITDRFFAVAPRVAREAVEMRLARPGSVTVVPSAVELEQIPHAPAPGLRGELGIPDGVPLVGTVGRLDLQKAPLDFVRMAARVADRHPDARFVMVGEGSLRKEAEQEADRLGVDVLFTGFRADAPEVAATFDVFVISSLYEGLGRALTEALASARPVVATAVNGVPDLVEAGATGLLAPPGQPQRLAECVIWLIDHPDEARRMGGQGRARVLSLFEPERMCRLIQHGYEELLGLPPEEPVAERAESPAEQPRNGVHRSNDRAARSISVRSPDPNGSYDASGKRGRAPQAVPHRAPDLANASADARVLNWRFVAPREPAGMLLLPADGERLDLAVIPDRTRASLAEVLASGPYPAVAVPDLTPWVDLVNGRATRALLDTLAGSVAPGGWLYAGFSNPYSPTRLFARGCLSRGSATNVLARAGLSHVEVYLPFPDHRLPAYLVSSSGGLELDYFLRHLAFPHVGDSSGWRGQARRRAAAAMHRAALAAPLRLREGLVPSFAIVASRPG